MLRALLFFVKLAIVVAAAVWVAERPGAVSLEWLGYRIDTAIGVLLAAVLIVAVAAAILYRVWRLVARSPLDVSRARREGRRRKGYRALAQGMVAVAAGDAADAKRMAARARGLLDEPALTMLLAAQAAQLNGDEMAAAKYFEAMLKRPDSALLGMRGLLMQALRAGNDSRALELARLASDHRPGTAWAVKTLLDLQLKKGDWIAAEASLKEAVKLKAVDGGAARRIRACILTERANGVGVPEDLLPLAEEAARLVPDLVPARAAIARLMAASGRVKAAAKAIEQLWPSMPHPDLADILGGLVANETPIERARRYERLAQRNPDSRASWLALGQAALDARMWGEARVNLERAAADNESPMTAGLARLLARLEEGERGDSPAARRWWREAGDAPPDAAWLCEQCGTPSAPWRAVCGNCGAFDSLTWRQPARMAAKALPILKLESAPTPLKEPEDAPPPPPPVAANRAVASPDDSPGGAPVDAARLVN